MNAKLRTRALSLMLTILMLFSTFTVFPVSAGASAAASAPVIIPMTDFASASQYLQIFKLPAVPDGIANTFSGGAGVYHFDADDKALTLDYATEADGANYYYCNVHYRIALRIKATNTLSESHTFMSVTYRTDTTEKASLKISNYSSDVHTLAEDVSVSKGEWIRSAPVDLSGTTVFQRMRNPNSHNALIVNITDPNALFQIKEVAFFATEAEANEYAFDPLVYDFTAAPTQIDALNKVKTLDVYPSGIGIYNANLGNITTTGQHLFNAEENCLELPYTPATTQSGVKSFHRFTFKPVTLADAPTASRPYMVVKYRTNAEAIGDFKPKIVFSSWNASEGRVILTDDASGSDGEWVYTAPVHLEDNLDNYTSGTRAFQRFNKLNHCILHLSYYNDSITVPNTTTFAVKEIAFFASAEQANAYIQENTPVVDNSADITLTASVPAEIVPGETFDADIVASTAKDDAKELTSANLTLAYSDTLTLNSIIAADGIGGEGVRNDDNYGWYFDGETPVTVTKDSSAVIAKASFTASAALVNGDTVEVGFADDEDALNIALADDVFQLGFKPDVVKGTATVKIASYKFTVPAGFAASLNDGAVAAAGTVLDVKAGDKLVLTVANTDIIVKSLTYKFGTGAETVLAPVNGAYTVPTDAINGDITVSYTTYDYSFIEADEYMALAADQKIFVIPTAEAGVNDTTYTIGGEFNKTMYYSSRYDAYVAIVDVDATPAAIGAALTAAAAPAEAVMYNGDINKDGKVTAGDAALVSTLLHGYTSDSKASDRPAVTDIMRLEADVCGKYVIGGSYVSVVDSTWVLYASVGLIFDAPEEEVKIEGIIIPTTSYAEANKKLNIYTLENCPTDTENSYGSNVGNYEFDPLEAAFSLKHAHNTYMGSNFKFHLILDKTVANTVTDESWMVITYRTNYNGATKASIKLTSNQFSADTVTLADDISVSGGEYVFSTPVNLNANKVENNANLFVRLKNMTHSALTVTMPESTDDSETYFYIKELAFFESEKMAKAYIANTELPEASTDTYTKFPLYDLDTAKNNLIIYNNDHIINGTAHSYNTDIGPGQVGEYRKGL